MTYEFIDEGSSFTVINDNSTYNTDKVGVELIINNTKPTVLEVRSNSSKFNSFIIDLSKDTVLGVGSGSSTPLELMKALRSIFFLSNGGSGSLDDGTSFNELFTIERNEEGDIVKTISIYDFKVPPESIEVGESIKISDLGQSLSYSTKFDGKQYILLGQNINASGSSRPFAKELASPTSFDIQPLFEDTETFGTQAVFPITSLQSVIGSVYRLKAQSDSSDLRIRLLRKATGEGVDTVIVDEFINKAETNIDGFNFNLKPLTDFTVNTEYVLILSVNDGDTFQVKGTNIINNTFVPYIRREVGWEYVNKDIAYIDDLVNYVPASDKGQPNGVAPLNSEGKIDPNYLYEIDVDGGLEIVGYWDADTNTPDLSSLTLERGQAYQVSVAGDTSLNGYDTWNEFDLAIWGDNITGNWIRIVSTEKVLSVNGEKGEVVVDKNSVGLSNVDNTSDQDKPLSNASINALSSKVNTGDNVSELNNDAGYITADDLPEIPSPNAGASFLLKNNILNNINVTSGVNGQYEELDCFGSLKYSEGAGWNIGVDGVTVPQDGSYQISTSVVFNSSSQRATPVISISIDGALVGDESTHAYIRNNQGISKSSCVLTTIVNLSEGQTVGLKARREGEADGAIKTVNSGSFFAINKVSNPVDSIGASSLNELSDVNLSTPPEVNQILKFNGVSFVPENESSGSNGSVVVIDKEVGITQTSWNANENYVYENISVPNVKVGQLCIVYPDVTIWQTIQANYANWGGYAYCRVDGLVTVVCRVSAYIGISPLTTFSVKIIDKIASYSNMFSEPLKTEVDFYSENISVSTEDHNKHFNILSPMNYNVTLPPLDSVKMTSIYKFKNLNDSTLRGVFTPLYGENIENQSYFELNGRGTISLRKKYSENGAKWSIVEISNLFDHVGQGKSKEVAFNNHNNAITINHNRGYRPIVKVYVSDGFGDYSEAEVDIDHNESLNTFIVNLEGENSGFIRYI